METLITPVDVIGDIQALVDTEASVRYPETLKVLVDAYRQLFSLSAAGTAVSWNQVGFSCRQALITFAAEVFDASFVLQEEEQPKGDDAQAKLKWTVRFHLRSGDAGDRYRESLEKIVEANWRFVNSLGHRQPSATEPDARLALIYTYLTIWLVDGVIVTS